MITKDSPDYEYFGNLTPMYQITCIECQQIDEVKYILFSDSAEKWFTNLGWVKRQDGKWVCHVCKQTT